MSLKTITRMKRMKTRIIQKMTVTAMSLTENMMDGIPDTQMKVITNSRTWRIIVKKV